jgi:hypothetical protein
MCFQTKNTLKNNYYHSIKHYLKHKLLYDGFSLKILLNTLFILLLFFSSLNFISLLFHHSHLMFE